MKLLDCVDVNVVDQPYFIHPRGRKDHEVLMIVKCAHRAEVFGICDLHVFRAKARVFELFLRLVNKLADIFSLL